MNDQQHQRPEPIQLNRKQRRGQEKTDPQAAFEAKLPNTTDFKAFNEAVENMAAKNAPQQRGSGTATERVIVENEVMFDEICQKLFKAQIGFDMMAYAAFFGEALRAKLRVLIIEGKEDVYAIADKVLGYPLPIDPEWESKHGRAMPSKVSPYLRREKK